MIWGVESEEISDTFTNDLFVNLNCVVVFVENAVNSRLVFVTVSCTNEILIVLHNKYELCPRTTESETCLLTTDERNLKCLVLKRESFPRHNLMIG